MLPAVDPRGSDLEPGDPLRRSFASAAAAVAVGGIAGLPGLSLAEETAEEGAAGELGEEQSVGSQDGLDVAFPRVTVPYKGKDLPLTKFIGKATVVVNVKTDDPEAVKQYPALGWVPYTREKE